MPLESRLDDVLGLCLPCPRLGGQARTVFVHRLVTLGTFEERLDAMI